MHVSQLPLVGEFQTRTNAIYTDDGLDADVGQVGKVSLRDRFGSTGDSIRTFQSVRDLYRISRIRFAREGGDGLSGCHQ